MAPKWYVLRSKPNKEDELYMQVMRQGFDIFYPCQTFKPANPRARKTKPYFTSYMFVHVNLQETGPSIFQWMPYSTGLVNFGGEPAVIPTSIMQALISFIESLAQKKMDARDNFLPGSSLKVVRGPFSGYEAIFDIHLSGNDRIRVLLNLAKGNRMPLELPASHVVREI